MTLTDLILRIKDIAKGYNVVSVTDGDVYANWNDGTIKYNAVNVDVNEIRRNNNGQTISIYLYYGDRLLQDKSNSLAVQDDGTMTLQGIINSLKKIKGVLGIEDDVVYTPFEQQFTDYLAGVYVSLNVSIKSEIGDCVEVSGDRVLDIEKNGIFNTRGYEKVNVEVQPEVPEPVYETLSVTENGSYTPTEGVDAYDRVEVNVQPTLSSISITENGSYTPSADIDGYDDITVDVQPELERLNVTENGSYTPIKYGFDEVNVSVVPTLSTLNVTANGTYVPTEGVDGFSVVNITVVPTLSTISITKNGTYTPSADIDGFNSIEVNVQTEDRYIIHNGMKFAFWGNTALNNILSNAIWDNDISDFSYMYANCRNLTSIVLPNDMTQVTLMDRCFDSCRSLTSVVLPSELPSVTNMSACFYFCGNLTSISLPNDMSQVTNMYQCFQQCTSLQSITLPENMTQVTNIGFLFDSCSNLTSIILPPTLSKVTNVLYTFSNCKKLEDINQTILPITALNGWYMSNCTALTEQSVINVLNSLQDTGGKSYTVTIGTTNINKLVSAEGQAALNNAIAKGWTIN